MKLHAREMGSGKPMMILHGLFGYSDNWQSQAIKLSEYYRIILVDLRNHGHSDWSDEFSSEIMAADRQGITHKNVPFGELVALDHIVNTGDGSGWSPVRSRDGTPAPDGVDPILYTHFDEAGLINTPEGRQQLRDRQILHQQQKEYLQRIQEQATIAQTKKELDAIQSYGIDTTSKTPQIKPNVFDNRNKRSKK